MKNPTDTILEALTQIAPTYKWEEISTGGGCTAIWGENPTNKKVVMITDLGAQSPESFIDDAMAIYYTDNSREEGWKTKPWTDEKPFFELIGELANDLNEWENEETEIEKLNYRLGEFAEELEANQWRLSEFSKLQLIDDLRTAVQLLTTHATEGNKP